MDVFSKSDPRCVVYLRPFGSKAWAEVARTEHIQNTLNPDFAKKVSTEPYEVIVFPECSILLNYFCDFFLRKREFGLIEHCNDILGNFYV